MLDTIVFKSGLSIQNYIGKYNLIDYNMDLMDNLREKYIELYNELSQKIQDRYCGKDEANSLADKLSEFLDVMYNIKKEEKNYYLTRDLINAKKDALLDMKYFADADAISQFDEEYEKAIQNKDIKKMSDMINDVQQNILKEWEKYLADLDSMNDDKFAFLGHSTSPCEFKGEFYSQYISTSLFNQDLTDTYRSGFGFVFAPKKIVGASSSDMYVNNYVEEGEDLLNYSAVAKISSPQRIIDECLKLKQENQKDGNDKKVYSEVVIDGFEPIGLFCFTDGSKNFDFNYQSVHKLQDNFPNLKIYSFDIMKRKKGVELNKMKLSLLNSLDIKLFGYNDFRISEQMLSKYDYFFEKFEKLKQDTNYDEKDIETIFKKNRELLSIFIFHEYLFDGRYSEEEIKYILRKNSNYNIDNILSGHASKKELNSLKELSLYKDKLNYFYDGLGELVDLVSRIEVTDEMMLKINESNSINFYTISKVLADEMMKTIDSREKHVQQNLDKFQIQYNELLEEIEKRKNVEEQYDYYYSIWINSHWGKMLKEDYNEVVFKINSEEEKEDIWQSLLNEVTNQLKEINEEINFFEGSKDDNVVKHSFYKKFFDGVKLNLSTLSKYSILRRKNVEKVKDNLKSGEYKDKVLMGTFRNKEEEELISRRDVLNLKKETMECELEKVQSDKVNLYQQLKVLKVKIKDYFKCDSIDEIDSIILEAKDFIDNYDYDNGVELSMLEEKLEKLNNMIINQENSLDSIREERELISKGR